ncbi:hypothetical protein [Hymenobacter aerophilus]|uniref:hypothetical protein n=1 Tax=Hymenobacter aerophilus TaxID=119644 RepID=UPI00037E6923|nr:hypothetical protein [Hymenobacter aerophilus]
MEALRRDFGSKADDGIALIISAGSEQKPAVQDFLRKYSISLASAATVTADQTINRDYYRKLVDGQGLTDAEIGGRLLMIDKVEVTAEQLRALPAGAVSALSISNSPIPKYGERGRKGMIFVMTKDRAK